MAGSNGPRESASSARANRPLRISKRRLAMSSWGTRSQARCSGGPSARAASRDPASAPAAAPVATCRDTITTVETVDLPTLVAACGALAARARRAQTASLLNRGRSPSTHPDGLPVRPRRYAADAAYLPREVFFGRFALAGAFFSVWATDFGRFFPATSRSFRLIRCRGPSDSTSVRTCSIRGAEINPDFRSTQRTSAAPAPRPEHCRPAFPPRLHAEPLPQARPFFAAGGVEEASPTRPRSGCTRKPVERVSTGARVARTSVGAGPPWSRARWFRAATRQQAPVFRQGGSVVHRANPRGRARRAPDATPLRRRRTASLVSG